MKYKSLTRRSLLTGAMGLSAGLAGAQRRPRPRRLSANDKVNIAVVGAGGRGADNVADLLPCGVNIAALADCDEKRAAETFKGHPAAKKYSDWRRMFDQAKDFDAVLVATPDHNHAIVSVAAMRLGKHVYCEKPLARTIWEARQMARAARESGESRVMTQMGTQGHAFEGTRRAVEVIRSGAIGEVRELHVWTDRPAGWRPQGVTRPKTSEPVPAGMNWDVWLGPAPARPYNPAYAPFVWRGFWDFGTGAIGDMGIHNLDTAFWALELTAPTSVEVKAASQSVNDPAMKDSAPLWSIIEFLFPSRKGKPPVKMTWYDGGKLPAMELFQGEPMISRDGGSLVIGSKGTLFTRTWHGGHDESDMFVLLPRRQFEGFRLPGPSLPRTKSHHQEWIDSIRGPAKCHSNFGYAAVLTESLLLGNVALRTGKRIEWEASRLIARGVPEAGPFIRPETRTGWTIS